MTKLDKFCKYTPLKVFGISIIISVIIFIVYSLFFMEELTPEEMRNSHGEAGFSHILILGACITYSFICSLCSYSIYLNLYKTVRDKFIFSLLSFFSPIILFPLIAGLFGGLSNGLLPSLQMMFFAIPFIIPQIYYFLRFRMRLESGEILEDFYVSYYEDN
ncbi:hypothetical protein [Dysgonomonas sp. ZJ709]|uniref:hypothetical protein n=1 Tax=Dysgonomonas sp. ZJ709 TaxID=2709797 RepID=UPI0013EB5F21|nr:hypothetical protein [Dysgonomonas sp. ZJ709]